jgi:hypothetical protein
MLSFSQLSPLSQHFLVARYKETTMPICITFAAHHFSTNLYGPLAFQDPSPHPIIRPAPSNQPKAHLSKLYFPTPNPTTSPTTHHQTCPPSTPPTFAQAAPHMVRVSCTPTAAEARARALAQRRARNAELVRRCRDPTGEQGKFDGTYILS